MDGPLGIGTEIEDVCVPLDIYQAPIGNWADNSISNPRVCSVGF